MEEFEKEFTNDNWCDCCGEYESSGGRRKVKDFISSSIKDVLIGVVPKEHDNYKDIYESLPSHVRGRIDGWNDCRETLLTNINRVLEENK